MLTVEEKGNEVVLGGPEESYALRYSSIQFI